MMDVESKGRVFLSDSLMQPALSLTDRVKRIRFYPRFFVLAKPDMIVFSLDTVLAHGFGHSQPIKGTFLTKAFCGD